MANYTRAIVWSVVLSLTILGLLILGWMLTHNYQVRRGVRPNIVFILADDLGYNDIGYRNPEAISPNLDRMAREGIILENNYVQSVCTPSRHALLSSKYPFKSRMQHGVLADPFPSCSPTNLRYLGSFLKELGYTTHLAGKWHLGFCQEACLPTRRGFDTFTGLWTGLGDQFHHISNAGAYDFRENKDINIVDNGTHTTDVVRDALLDAIANKDREAPLFLMATFTAVHTPHQEPQHYIDMYPKLKVTNPQRGKYLAMLTHMDEAIADIVQGLKDNDLWDNTLLVFSSDNGGEDGGFADNSPLRGAKGSLWEGGNRVVGFVAGGLVEKGGTTATGLFHQVDWAPTFITMAGGTPDADLDGIDQTDLILRAGSSNRKEIIYNIDDTIFGNFMADVGANFGQAAIRQGPWKLIWGPTGFADGYGLNVTRYWHIQSNLDLIGWNGTVPIPIPRPPRPSGSPCPPDTPRGPPGPERIPVTPADRYLQRAINEALMFDSSDIDSGTHHLFNLQDDPNETNDLGQDPDKQHRVLQMKRRILDLIEDGYEAPDPEVFRASLDSLPCHFEGNAETGWCPNSDFDLDDRE